MPVKLSALRAQYPMYESVNDDQLLSAIHRKFYPDMPIGEFVKNIDYDTQRESLQKQTLDDTNTFAAGMGRPVQQLINTGKRLTGNMTQEQAADEAHVADPLMHTVGGFAGNLAGEAALTYLGGRGLQAAGNVAGRVLPQAVAAAQRLRSGASALGNTAEAVAGAVPVAGRVLAPAVSLARTVAPAAAAGAVQGAAFNPEDFGQGAKWGAGGGAAGAGIAAGAGRVIGGALAPTVSADARALMDQGMTVPMWKATDNAQVRNIAERVRRFPVVGPVMKRQEVGAIEDYTRALQQQATPPRMPVTDRAGNILSWQKSPPLQGVGQDAMAELGERFRTGYDAIYGNRSFPVDETFTSAMEDLSNATRMHHSASAQGVDEGLARAQQLLMQGKEGQAGARSAILDASGNPFQHADIPGHVGVENSNINQALAELDQRIKDNFMPGGNPVTARILKDARGELEDMRTRGLPPEVQSELGDMNSAYANYKLLAQAAKSGGAVRREGIVTPLQMTNAAMARDKGGPGKMATVKGTAHGLQDAQQAQRVLGSELPEVGPGTADAGLLGLLLGGGWAAPTTTAIATGLATPTGQRLIQGGYPWQTATREGTNTLAELLRQGGRAGTVLGEAQAADPNNQ